MIKHVVAVKWKDQVPSETRALWLSSIEALTGSIPQIRTVSTGTDLLKTPRSYDAAAVVEFDTVDDLQTYLAYPDHVAVSSISQGKTDALVIVNYAFD